MGPVGILPIAWGAICSLAVLWIDLYAVWGLVYVVCLVKEVALVFLLLAVTEHADQLGRGRFGFLFQVIGPGNLRQEPRGRNP